MTRLVVALVVASSLQAPAVGTVRLSFGEDGKVGTTALLGSVYFEVLGGGVREFPVRNFSRPMDIPRLAPGTYRFAVVAQTTTRVLVSADVAVGTIRHDGEVVDLPVNLIARKGAIRVINSLGAPAAGAHYYTRPPAVSSSADASGRIPLALLAAGTELTVRTIDWGMTCHVVTANTQQTIVVPDAVEELVIATPIVPPDALLRRRHVVSSPLLAGASIAGIPGADCAVPFTHFPVVLANRDGRTEHTVLLPFGEYTLRLPTGRVIPASVPGRVDITAELPPLRVVPTRDR